LLFGCKQVSGFPEGHVPQTPSTRTRMEPNNRKRIPSLHEGCILEFHAGSKQKLIIGLNH
jgi:hypothetical protein